MTEKKAPELLLATTWTPKIDPTGWWMSEKLDGVRAYWDGRNFISRLGNVFHAPDWFKKEMPHRPLDGELWIGRGQFQLLVGTVKRLQANENWKKVKYLVFDAPDLNMPFEKRLEKLRALLLGFDERYVELVKQNSCRGEPHLMDWLERTVAYKGEGLMLRQPGSYYEGTRSLTLLKVKKFLDAEAVVIGHQPGKGKHSGRLGALHCMLPDGTEFDIGTGFTDAERENPPKIGSTVTVRFQELSRDGVPRFPSYVSVRHVS